MNSQLQSTLVIKTVLFTLCICNHVLVKSTNQFLQKIYIHIHLINMCVLPLKFTCMVIALHEACGMIS